MTVVWREGASGFSGFMNLSPVFLKQNHHCRMWIPKALKASKLVVSSWKEVQKLHIVR